MFIPITFLLAFLFAQEGTPDAPPHSDLPNEMSAATFRGLRLRSIGPAFASGRVTSIAVNPLDKAHYFVGVASGGVWKTTNSGTTWTAVFDDQGSYSIGTVVLDPKNPNTVWVGTGENNSQRSVSYGDGIYRSDDGGKTWRNTGLKTSEHIGRIAIDPRDSNRVYVASQGPLWAPGGERGLYRTNDGGKNWTRVLEVSENTGITDVTLDPSNPDIVLAASYQRRRHVWTLINGGPESAIHKSTDGGATWRKITSGLPNEDLGRIGLAFSPAQRGLVYARVEAANKAGGIFRSTDSGESWEKRGSFDDLAMYYGQIIADPKNPERIFVMNTIARISEDGGRTARPLGDRAKHIDTHALWVDPENSDHMITGCDGGVYETWDSGRLWQFKANLPVTQFYDITVDNSSPEYLVCGGTQDNNTFCGPARTRSAAGIVNSDFFVTTGGDGFHVRVDPDDPNIIYSEAQYGVLTRFDKRTGERVGIKPVEGKGEPPLRWNWDSPLLMSPHSSKRLYFAANKLFRSDDRGDSWRTISSDLTRQLDRDRLPVMGRIWSPDAVAKNNSTSFYGNIVALAESPKREGLLYAGTDDGLIQVTDNAGAAWRKIESFPGVPERTYVARLLASQHDENTVYAAFENHKAGDFKPYLLKSTGRGSSWTAIQSNLPANGPVLAIAEDHVNPQLLFVGTEFGLFFTIDGGGNWVQLKGGMPTISVRDLAIQKRENDLAVGTFGRGFYILDDYTPLRSMKSETLKKEAVLFPARSATAYIERRPFGGRGKAWQGENFWNAENPPFGAVFTYYLKDSLQTAKQRRQQAEKKKDAAADFPSREQLVKEAEEEEPAIVLTVTDATGKVVRRVSGPSTKGFHRVAWDLKTPAPALLPARTAAEGDEDNFTEPPGGHFVRPGKYTTSLAKRVDGVTTNLSEPQTIEVKAASPEITQHVDFQEKLVRLVSAVNGALEAGNSARQRLAAIKRAVQESQAPVKLREDAGSLDRRLSLILRSLRGDEHLRDRQENQPQSVSQRINSIRAELNNTTGAPTKTHQSSYEIAREALIRDLASLRQLLEVDLKKLEKELEAHGVPHTPGRMPELR